MVFYLNVFYLPVLKQVIGQYKMWNDVMFWFSQIKARIMIGTLGGMYLKNAFFQQALLQNVTNAPLI